MRQVLDVTFTPAAPYLLARSIGSPDLSRSFRGSVLQLAYPAGEHDATAHVWQRHDGTPAGPYRQRRPVPPHTTACTGCSAVGLDTTPFLRMAADDPLLRPMTSRLRGLRPLMLATPEHALIRAVCGQLIRSSDALAIERRIIRRLGRPCGRFMLAPAAETLASAHPALLERAGLSPKRAVVLTRAARRLRLEALADRSRRAGGAPHPSRAGTGGVVGGRGDDLRIRPPRARAGRRPGAGASGPGARASRATASCWPATAPGRVWRRSG